MVKTVSTKRSRDVSNSYWYRPNILIIRPKEIIDYIRDCYIWDYVKDTDIEEILTYLVIRSCDVVFDKINHHLIKYKNQRLALEILNLINHRKLSFHTRTIVEEYQNNESFLTARFYQGKFIIYIKDFDYA